MITVTSITLHTNPASAAKTVSAVSGRYEAVTNVLDNCPAPAEVSYKLGQYHTMNFAIGTGTPFGSEVIANDWFDEDESIKVTFSDSSVEWWRIKSRSIDYGGGKTIKVSCIPYWSMLARRQIRIHREPRGVVDTTLTLHRKTATEVLTEILSYNAPPYFAVGTVDSSFSTELVDIEINNSKHLQILQQLCQKLAEFNGGFPAEFETRWSGTTCYIDIVPFVGASSAEIANSYTPDPSSRLITGGLSTDPANRLVNKVTRGNSEQFNRIIPTAGDQNTPVTIGQAAWLVSDIDFIGGGVYECDVAENPFGGALDVDAAETLFFGSSERIDPDDPDSAELGFYQVLSVTSNGAIHTVKVTSDPSLLLNKRARFARDVAGQELVYLGTSEATSDDIIEAPTFFDKVVPYDNLLEDAGVSTDFSLWASGKPVGASTVGTATYTQVDAATYPAYVRWGDYSAKIECAKDSGVRLGQGTLTLATNDVDKYFAFTVNVAVEQGRIRVVLVDSDGKRHPQGIEQAESKVANVVSVVKGGFDCSEGSAYLEVMAMEDDTIFYLDSVNITRSVGWWPYAAQMGPRALWKAGREALTQQSLGRDIFDTKYIDPSFLSGLQATPNIGSYVQIKDAYNGSAYELSVSGRIRELKRKYSTGLESIMGQIKVSKPRPDFTARLASSGLVGLPQQTVGFEAPSDFFESVYTEDVTGDIIATVNTAIEANEPTRTNLWLWSNEASKSTTSFISIDEDTLIAPDGTLTADEMVEDTSTNYHMKWQLIDVTESDQYVLSGSFKYVDRQWVRLILGDTGFPTSPYAYFDIQNGVKGTEGAGIDSATITVQSDGWYRCEIIGTADATVADCQMQVIMQDADSGSTHLGTNARMGVWGMQLEKVEPLQTAEISDLIYTTSIPATRTGGQTEIDLLFLANVRYGTELEVRAFGGADPVTFWLLESAYEGDDKTVQISFNEPMYELDNEGDPEFVLNQIPVSFPVEVGLGAAVVANTVSLLSRIYQAADLIELLQKKVENSGTLRQITVLGEDASGSITSLDNLKIPTRVSLREGYNLTIETAAGLQQVTVTQDTEAGSLSIPVVTEGINAKAGDIVSMDPLEILSFVRIQPSEVKLAVTKGKKQTALAVLATPLAAGFTTSIPLEATLTVNLADNSVYLIEDAAGNTLQVTLDGPHTVGDAALTVDSVNIPYIWIDGFLRLSEAATQNAITINEAGILLRVQYDEIVASINLSVEGVQINADLIAIDGTTVFATGYDPSTKARTYRQPTEPVSPNIGDLWLDTGDLTLFRLASTGPNVWEAVGTDDLAWRHASDYTKIDGGEIFANSITLQGIDFDIATTYRQSAEPTGNPKDLWLDTDTNILYRRNDGDTAWEEVGTNDTLWRHASDLTKIDGGEIFANSITLTGVDFTVPSISRQALAPSSPDPEDLWLDTDTNILYRRNDGDTAWDEVGTNDTAWRHASDITKIDGGDIYADSITLTGVDFIVPVVSRQALAPTSPAPQEGDLWLDTDIDILYRHDGVSTWEEVGTNDTIWRHASDTTKIDGGEIFADSITLGQVDFAVTATYRQVSEPTGAVGDLWYKTTDDTLWYLASIGPQVWEEAATNDTAWRHASDATKIDGGAIYTNSVTTTEVNFAVVDNSNIVGTINSSTEGIDISGAKIAISGSTTFSTGYDPSEHNTTYRQSAAPSVISGDPLTTGDIWHDTDDLKVYRYESGVWWTIATHDESWRHGSDTTKINGGDIYTNSITATQISVSSLDAITGVFGDIDIDGTLTMNGGEIVVGSSLSIDASGIDMTVVSGTAYDAAKGLSWSNTYARIYALTSGTGQAVTELVLGAYSSFGGDSPTISLVASNINIGGIATFALSTDDLRIDDASDTGGTEAGYIQLTIGGTTRYIRTFSTS